MSVFSKRMAFKPFEYPECVEYKKAINHSYWLVSEWNFISDIQDFNVILNDKERNAIRNAMLAISQVEVAVKKFWTKLGNRFPKAEFEQVGVTFGESEVRHSDAYSHLLEVLQLNDDFDTLFSLPVIKDRVEYLSKVLLNVDSMPHEEYVQSLALFSIFVENVSLFSQFLIIKSFNKYKNILKDIENVVQGTQKEEDIHAKFGVYLIKTIREENPTWFGDRFKERIYTACNEAYQSELNLVDWIFEDGEIDFLPVNQVKEFVKNRFNSSLELIGLEKLYEEDKTLVDKNSWFNDEIYSQVNVDFFYKKPVTYSKRVQAITAGDLF